MKALILLACLNLIVIIALLLQEPIAQDINYHLFKDTRTVANITNFYNVISNLAFFIVGVSGLIKILLSKNLILIQELKFAYILFFLGVTLVAFGSGYYHLSPNNGTLLWDRLPMTIAFMALFAIIIGEFVSVKLGKILLLPFVVIGVTSVIYWHLSESWGEGDLRYYILVQFLPILSIPVILFCFQSNYTKVSGYWWLLFAYIFAKLFEFFDGEIFGFLGVISGHSLKHIVAAGGLFILLHYYQSRRSRSCV